MAENTAISWCDHTINFWWGCAKVSPACANCYAEGQSARFHPGHWGPDAPRLTRVEAARREAMRYERRAMAEGRRFRVFTNSMSDFFEDRRDLDGARLEALDVIRKTPHLDWLILTKRPEKIVGLIGKAWAEVYARYTNDDDSTEGLCLWLDEWLQGNAPANVWLGTTVEDQERADQRILALLQVPAAIRFLSCEPLLGPVDLRCVSPYQNPCGGKLGLDALAPDALHLDWVIAGGESGPHARPLHPDWARGLRDQCAASGVPFLFKQWGSLEPIGTVDGKQILPFATYLLPGTPGAPAGGFGFRRVPGKGHDLLDGVSHHEFPVVSPNQ